MRFFQPSAATLICHDSGLSRCTPNGASAFHYEYTLKDHLGNARVNFRANGTAITFLQELHYYPFGMVMEGIGTAEVTDNAYQYNGKEWNEDLGLNWSDYGARWYDAALGRWWAVDPLGEDQANYSTYTYVFNNPIFYHDPTGMSAADDFYNSADGLTNEQWLASSNPSNKGKTADQYRKENRQNDGGQKSKNSAASDWYPEEKNGNIYLVAEQGDNEKSLKQWANGAFSNSEISELYGNLTKGKIDLSGTFIGKFMAGFMADRKGNCQFNCFSAVISGFLGDNISDGWGESNQNQFNFFVSKSDMSVNPASSNSLRGMQPFNSIFGYSVPGEVGLLDHVSVFAGNDRSGTPWVLTKNGFRTESDGSFSDDNRYQFQKGATFNGWNGSRQPDIVYQKK